MASYALRGAGAEVGPPTMVGRPLNGRAWTLEVAFPTMSTAERYVAPEQHSIVQQVVGQYDGQIPGNEYRR